MEIPRGGGRFNRLGVATLSGLLAIGLTPAFANVALADPAAPAPATEIPGVTVDGNKVTIQPAAVIDKGNEKETSKFGDLYQIKVTADGSNNTNNCGKVDMSGNEKTLAYTVDGKDFKKFNAAALELDFSSFTETTEKTCVYTVEQEKKDSSGDEPAGWTIDKTGTDRNKFTLTLTAQKETGKTLALKVKTLKKGKDANATGEADKGLTFVNQAPWVVSLWADMTDDSDQALKTIPVSDGGTLETTSSGDEKDLPKLGDNVKIKSNPTCTSTKKATLSGWTLKGGTDLFQDKDATTPTKIKADTDLVAVCTGTAKHGVKFKKTVTVNGVENPNATLPDGVFKATLTKDNNNAATCPDPASLANSGKVFNLTKAGVFEFPQMEFKTLGVCKYTIAETATGSDLVWGHDETQQKVTVTVTSDPKAANGLKVTQDKVAELKNSAPVTVTFKTNEGSFKATASSQGGQTQTVTGAAGAQLTLPADLDAPKVNGKAKFLAGWTVEGTNTVVLADGQQDAVFPEKNTTYVAVWAEKTVEVKFYKPDGKTPIGTGIQKLPEGAPLKTTTDAGVGSSPAVQDLTTAAAVCMGTNDTLNGWKKNGQTLTPEAMAKEHAAENAVYTADCTEFKVTFKGGKFKKDGGNEFSETSKTVAITKGSGSGDADSIAAGDIPNETTAGAETIKPADETKGKNLKGWKVKVGGKDILYTTDLNHTIPVSDPDKPYVPVAGDVLTAAWGHKVTFLKNDGDELETGNSFEYVENNGSPTGLFSASGAVAKNAAAVKVCAAGTSNGKWFQGADTDKAKAAVKDQKAFKDIQVTSDIVLRADCSLSSNIYLFDANGGDFEDSTAAKDANHYTVDGAKKVLTYTGVKGDTFNAPGKTDLKPADHSGNVFLGWGKTATTDKVETLPETVGDGGKFYAVWWKAGEDPKIDINDSNADPVAGATVYVKKGQIPVLPTGDKAKALCKDTKNAPDFKEWHTEKGQVYTPAALNESISLLAVCHKAPTGPSVMLEAGEGNKFKDGQATKTVLGTELAKFNEKPAYKDNTKLFSKWCEKPATGELDKTNCESVDLTKFTIPEGKTPVLVAVYTDAVTVKFDANGGKFAENKTTQELTVAKDSKVKAPVVETLPENRVFSKWCEKPEAGKELAADCTEVKLDKVEKNLDLVAVYKTAVTVKLFADKGDTPVNDKFSVAEGTLAKDVPAPEKAGDYCKADTAKTVFDKWVKKDGQPFADTDKVAANLELKASCKAPVVQHTVKVMVGTETKEIKVEAGKMLTADQLKTANVTCNDGETLNLTKDGAAFDYANTAVTSDLTLKAECKKNETPGGGSGGSTGGSTGGSSGGSYFGGGSGGSSTPSTPAKDKKPGDKKPGDKKPAENKFDKQFTKKVELPKSAVKRASGADRVATSVAALSLAKNHEVVVLATGSNFPDALVGGALAGAYKGGVVLTTGATLEQSILDSLKMYKTKTVHIIGGTGAVSAQKEAQLKAAGLQVVRHAGADRYATAQAVKAATLQALGGKSAIACNATGSDFPDALACSSAASQMGGTVDLVKPGAAVAKDATAKTVCAGGPACRAAGAGVDKVVGSDRYETAYKLAGVTPAKGAVLVSNGQSYADSLVAGALAGSLQADLVLAKPTRVNVPADTKTMHLFGGTAVLPASLPVYTK